MALLNEYRQFQQKLVHDSLVRSLRKEMRCTLRTLAQVQSGYPQSYRKLLARCHSWQDGRIVRRHLKGHVASSEHVSEDVELEILIDATPSSPVTNSPTDTDSPDLTDNMAEVITDHANRSAESSGSSVMPAVVEQALGTSEPTNSEVSYQLGKHILRGNVKLLTGIIIFFSVDVRTVLLYMEFSLILCMFVSLLVVVFCVSFLKGKEV